VVCGGGGSVLGSDFRSLSVLCRIGYLKWRRGVSDGRLSGMSLTHVWGVVVWLIVWRRISMIIGLVFRMSGVMLVRGLV
jgi:hypothetical protein